MRRILLSLLTFLVAFHIALPFARATILSSSVSFDSQSELYTYSYSIDNAGGTAPIWQFSLLVAPFGAGPLVGDPLSPFASITAPTGWSVGEAVSGSIAEPPYSMSGKFLYWNGFSNPIQIGASLSGFSFSTYLSPTTSNGNNYFLYGDASPSNLVLNGDLNIAEYGATLAPLAPVPEPSTWAMIILGFASVCLMRRQRRSCA
jgi:hypothetical protein